MEDRVPRKRHKAEKIFAKLRQVVLGQHHSTQRKISKMTDDEAALTPTFSRSPS